MQLNVKDNTIRIHGEIPVEQWPGFVEACNALIEKQQSGEVPGSDRPTLPIPTDFGVETERQSVLSPGSLLTTAIKLITGADPGPQCSCKHRARRMNEWGWWGCWRNRDTIAGWLVEEAQKRNHEIDKHKALSLFKAAWTEIRQRRKDEATRPS